VLELPAPCSAFGIGALPRGRRRCCRPCSAIHSLTSYLACPGGPLGAPLALLAGSSLWLVQSAAATGAYSPPRWSWHWRRRCHGPRTADLASLVPAARWLRWSCARRQRSLRGMMFCGWRPGMGGAAGPWRAALLATLPSVSSRGHRRARDRRPRRRAWSELPLAHRHCHPEGLSPREQ
jgi:hypothetical protein